MRKIRPHLPKFFWKELAVRSQSSKSADPHLTTWLRRAGQDSESLHNQLYLHVEGELRRQARALLRRERPNLTLQTTVLVDDAFQKLVAEKQVTWENRAQFFAFAARIMRQILIGHARKKKAAKRGGGITLVSLDQAGDIAVLPRSLDLLALDEALTKLASLDSVKSQIVEMQFFSGCTLAEMSAALAMPISTIRRKWQAARAWLHRELSKGSDHVD